MNKLSYNNSSASVPTGAFLTKWTIPSLFTPPPPPKPQSLQSNPTGWFDGWILLMNDLSNLLCSIVLYMHECNGWLSARYVSTELAIVSAHAWPTKDSLHMLHSACIHSFTHIPISTYSVQPSTILHPCEWISSISVVRDWWNSECSRRDCFMLF